MPDTLFNHEALAWSERQAASLRRSARALSEACPFSCDQLDGGVRALAVKLDQQDMAG